jgi:hypothetical protein
MKRAFLNRIHGNRSFFVPAAAFVLMGSVLLIPGCPGVAGGGAIGISISVLAPTVNRDLASGEKVTVVYNASGSINALEAVYDLDGTENTGDETVVIGGLPQGDNQFFDLNTAGIPAGTYFIGIRGTNGAGSTTSYASATVRVNGAPRAAFVNPDGTGAPVVSIVVGVGDLVLISFNMNDPENNVNWRVFYDLDQTPDNRTEVTIATGSGNSGNVEWDTRGVAPGTYFIGVTGTDNVGNMDTGYSPGTVTITRGAFITVTAPATDVLAFGGEDVEVRFAARGADGGGTIRVFYDTDGRFDNDEVTIADNLPVTTTSAIWDTNTAPNGDFFVGASVTDTLGNTAARYAAGLVQIRKEAGIEITKPAGETLVSKQKDDFLIEFFSTVPVGLGTIDIFFQAADAGGLPTGAEMAVVDNNDKSATDLPANTRSVEWDLTKLASAGEYVIGARLKMADGDLEDFSPVVTVSEIPTIELIEPTSNARPPVIVRDPLGNLTVVFRYTDPEDPKEVIVALDPDKPSANLDPTDEILDGDEIVFGPFTDLVPTTNPEEFPIPDGIDLEKVPSGVYYIFLRIEDEAGGVDQGYGASQRGEFIALEIRAGRLLGAFWVGQLELPVNGVKLDGAIFQGHNFKDHLGSAFLAAGDLTFDGMDDIVVCSRFGKPNNVFANGIGRGEASLVYGREFFLNPQPFAGTNFTFDINATGTALLPGSTFTGVPPSGSLTETNGLGQVVAMQDADGDGRKELAFGLRSVNSASESNSKRSNLRWSRKPTGQAKSGHVTPFPFGPRMIDQGQFLRGGLVMVSSTNGLDVSGQVVNLGDVGVAGFSGTVDYVAQDRTWEPEPMAVPKVPPDCIVNTLPAGTPPHSAKGVQVTIARGIGFTGPNANRPISMIVNMVFTKGNNVPEPEVNHAVTLSPGELNEVVFDYNCNFPFSKQGSEVVKVFSVTVDNVFMDDLEIRTVDLSCLAEVKYTFVQLGTQPVQILESIENLGCGNCKTKTIADQCCAELGLDPEMLPPNGVDPFEHAESVMDGALSPGDIAGICDSNDTALQCEDKLTGAIFSRGSNGFGTDGYGGGLSQPVDYDTYFGKDFDGINLSNTEWGGAGCVGYVTRTNSVVNPTGRFLVTGFFSGRASVPGARLLGDSKGDGFTSSLDAFGNELFAVSPGTFPANSPLGPTSRGTAYIWESGTSSTAPLQIVDAESENPVEITTAVPHGISGSVCVDIDGVLGMTQLNGNTYTATRTGPTTLSLSVNGEMFSNYVSGGTAFVNGSLWCEAQLAKPFMYGLNEGTLERGASVGSRVDPLRITGSLVRYNNGSGSAGLKPMGPLEQAIGIPDFNNDLRRDVAVGAPKALEGDGAVYIYYRRSKALEGNVNLESMELPKTDVNRLTGMMVRPKNGGPTNIHPNFGFSLARAGDLNNDGFQDIAVGAPGADQNRGEVVILFGGSNANSPGVLTVGNTVLTADPDSQDGLPGFTVTQLMDLGLAARIVGVSPGDRAGFNVTSAGDVDGDGNPDLLIAAPNATPMFDSNGDGAPDSAGIDNDGNGVADPVVNRSFQSVSSSTLIGAGLVYLVYGSNNLTGTINLADIGQPNLQGAVFVGAAAGELLGGGVDAVTPSTPNGASRSYGLSGAGDVNGDGNDDLLIGAMLADPNGKTDAGEAYLIFGTGGLK